MTDAQCVERAARILYSATYNISHDDFDYMTADACLSSVTPRYGATKVFDSWGPGGQEVYKILPPDPAHVARWHRLYNEVTRVVAKMAPPPHKGSGRRCPCGIILRKRQKDYCSKAHRNKWAYEGNLSTAPRPITSEERAIICTMYAEGAGINTIRIAVRRGNKKTRQVLLDAGIEIRRNGLHGRRCPCGKQLRRRTKTESQSKFLKRNYCSTDCRNAGRRNQGSK
jgi:hypothetical protein